MQLKKILLLPLMMTISLMATPLIEINTATLNSDITLRSHQSMLQNFYQNHRNMPLWLSNRGIKGQKVMQLLNYIRSDATLSPRGYITKKSQQIKKSLTHRHTQAQLINLELQLTTLYYELLQHTIYGEINWQRFESHLENLRKSKINAVWVRYPLNFDLIELMSRENITQTLRQVTPKQYGYKKLVKALHKLYSIKWKGGWGVLPPSKTLKLGSTGIAVQKLRQRLILSGDYRGCSGSTKKFDTCLNKAVKRFQRRHGLKADGSVGNGTRKILNISVDSKIKKLLLNIDRIKWLPRQANDRYIIVNIPEYMLHYIEYGREVKKLKVIVGDTKHPTPIFSNSLSYITLNPYWKIPESIVRKEIVPSMIKNPNHIKKQGLEAHETWEEDSPIVSLKNINWSDYLTKENKFPYRLMQPPGPKNALGKIKFKFPNRYDVYLHDTPTKHLFSKKRRAFSHGCIRLFQPLSLLKILSQRSPNINYAEAHTILKGKKKEELHLDNQIPINIVYLTAWVNSNNELTFGDDIYKYDKYQQRKIR